MKFWLFIISNPAKSASLAFLTAWVTLGSAMGGLSYSRAIASVPNPTPIQVTDDTAIYQNLSEIHVPKERNIDFDGDIHRLSSIEPRYREKLPVQRIAQRRYPFSRISAQKINQPQQVCQPH